MRVALPANVRFMDLITNDAQSPQCTTKYKNRAVAIHYRRFGTDRMPRNVDKETTLVAA
jgi:hypothetical protein